MFLLDTNILIYATKPAYGYLRNFIAEQKSLCSKISKIETLGFHSLTIKDIESFTLMFRTIEFIDITDNVIDKSIALKQKKKMSLGDSIIAATALEYDLTLATNNISDFKHIDGLKLLNPII